MSEVILEARGVELAYRARRGVVHALREVDLTVRAGDFLAVLGPSGSGKSSLLFVLAGLRSPTRGRVSLLGREWPDRVGDAAAWRREKLGFVFQEPFLIPYLTVRENAAIQTASSSDAGRLADLASALGLGPLLDEFPERLSAGEQQRASMLRALVTGPRLILADEPTAWLDRDNAAQVMHLLTRRLESTSLIVVTHDPSMVEDATRTLSIRDGRLTEASRS